MTMTAAKCRQILVQPDENKLICVLCNSSEIDEVKYGILYELEGVVAHHYCVLLASKMEQNGQDEEGIMGFLLPDILKEKEKALKTRCTYCNSRGATVLCSSKKCKIKFHVPCGIKNNCLNQFFGAFRSYCSQHRLSQKIPQHVIKDKSAGSILCIFCFHEVSIKPSPNTLWAPCCSKTALFHRECMQRFAISCGYFFKCPLCNDKASFQKAMLNNGIYIPQQDASWERSPNAYQELQQRHDTCDFPKCKCVRGRNFNATGTIWELLLCGTCAAEGIHVACAQLKFNDRHWDCPSCTKILEKAKKKKLLESSASTSCQKDSSPTSRGFRKRKKPVRKKKVTEEKSSLESIGKDSANGTVENVVRLPDESSDIILIDSDTDDIIEVVDSPKPLLSLNESNTIIVEDDSSSDIDVLNEIPLKDRLPHSNLSSIGSNYQPTALIALRDPNGNRTTVLPTSSFRNINGEFVPLNSFQTPVQMESHNPNVLITFSSANQLIDGNVNLMLGATSNFADSPSCSNSISSVVPRAEPSSSLLSRNLSQVKPRTSSIHSVRRSSAPHRQSNSSRFQNLPPTSEEKFLARYNNVGLKCAKVIIKPLRFLQIGENKFAVFVSSSKDKKKSTMKQKNGERCASERKIKKRSRSCDSNQCSKLSTASKKKKLSCDATNNHEKEKLILGHHLRKSTKKLNTSFSFHPKRKNSCNSFDKKLKPTCSKKMESNPKLVKILGNKSGSNLRKFPSTLQENKKKKVGRLKSKSELDISLKVSNSKNNVITKTWLNKKIQRKNSLPNLDESSWQPSVSSLAHVKISNKRNNYEQKGNFPKQTDGGEPKICSQNQKSADKLTKNLKSTNSNSKMKKSINITSFQSNKASDETLTDDLFSAFDRFARPSTSVQEKKLVWKCCKQKLTFSQYFKNESRRNEENPPVLESNKKKKSALSCYNKERKRSSKENFKQSKCNSKEKIHQTKITDFLALKNPSNARPLQSLTNVNSS